MTQAQSAPLERASFTAAMLVLACSVSFGIYFALQDDVRHLLLRVVDDASYFMNTARNIAEGRGMTFDGIHPTNGFHPLWLLMLVPLFLLQASSETMIRLVVLLQVVLLTVAFLLLHHTQSRLFSKRVALIGAIAFVSLVFMQALNGMESALFALLLITLYAYGQRIFAAPLTTRRALLFGLILGFMLLSRLDMIFIPLAILICCIPYVVNERTGNQVTAAMLTAAIATGVVVAPYLLFNITHFGSAMPISGALKSSFPAVALTRGTLEGIDHRDYAFAAFAFGWLLWRVVRTSSPLPRPGDDYYAVSTTVLAWAVIFHFLDTILFLQWGVFAWHFILYPLFAVAALGGIAHSILRWRVVAVMPGAYWLAVGVLVALTTWKESVRQSYPLDHMWHVASYNAAVWAREHTDPDTIFAMRDAGHFAFFSRRRVINLDGLVNNMDYQRVIANRHVRQYLHDNHVEYLVLHALPGRDDVIRGDYDALALNYMSHKFGIISDDVIVHERDEVYRSRPYFDGSDPAVCLIWSLNEGRDSRAASATATGSAQQRQQ